MSHIFTRLKRCCAVGTAVIENLWLLCSRLLKSILYAYHTTMAQVAVVWHYCNFCYVQRKFKVPNRSNVHCNSLTGSLRLSHRTRGNVQFHLFLFSASVAGQPARICTSIGASVPRLSSLSRRRFLSMIPATTPATCPDKNDGNAGSQV